MPDYNNEEMIQDESDYEQKIIFGLRVAYLKAGTLSAWGSPDRVIVKIRVHYNTLYQSGRGDMDMKTIYSLTLPIEADVLESLGVAKHEAMVVFSWLPDV